MTEIEFVGYSAVHPSDFIYDVPNGFTGYLLLLFDSPSELLIDGRLMRTAPILLFCIHQEAGFITVLPVKNTGMTGFVFVPITPS